jgi:hypothetical protein
VTLALTWEEVRARSEVRNGGLNTHRADCYFAFASGRLPCRKHATPEEGEAIDKLLSVQLSDHPLLRVVRKYKP